MRRPRVASAAVAVVVVMGSMLCAQACSIAGRRPNCDKMHACCAALTHVENGLPPEQEILCHHNPELDEGCVDTLSDIRKFTPDKNLPAICR
jgi:hypothetical protein